MTSAIAIRVIIRTGLLASLDSAHDDHLMALGLKLDTAGLAGWILNYDSTSYLRLSVFVRIR
jgi:hypothetical protein